MLPLVLSGFYEEMSLSINAMSWKVNMSIFLATKRSLEDRRNMLNYITRWKY